MVCDDGRMTSRIFEPKQKQLLTLAQYALTAMVLTASMHQPARAQAGAECVPGGSVQQTNACSIKAFQEADTNNQILYGDVMRSLSAHERPDLRRDQNEWTRHRNSQCKKSQAAYEAQPDWPRRYHDCLSEQIKGREAALKRWLHFGAPEQ